jgi:hypothetical protein
MLNQWITAYGSATAAGLDVGRLTSQFYVKYDTTKSAWVGSVPSNIILDAKTRKVLEKGFSYSQIPTLVEKHLNK